MYGVPPRGAFDQESLALANTLVGNEPGTPALELALATMQAEAECDLYVALVGSVAENHVAQSAFQLAPGETLAITPGSSGARCYLAVAGGWRGLLHERIKADILSAEPRAGPRKKLQEVPRSLEPTNLSIIPGPAAQFGFDKLLASKLNVRLDSDRVGIRLEGLQLASPPEQLSEPTVAGAIQITRDGSLIILGPDGPTIGGYPVLGYVATRDLSRLGQLRPGDAVAFAATTLEKSAQIWRETDEAFSKQLALLRLT